MAPPRPLVMRLLRRRAAAPRAWWRNRLPLASSSLGSRIYVGSPLQLSRARRWFCAEKKAEDASEEDFERARRSLQESVLPMFCPTGQMEPLPQTMFHAVFGLVQYVLLTNDVLRLRELTEGFTQARRYVVEAFNAEDFEALERVASMEVVNAFRETRQLWDASKNSGIAISYSVESIEQCVLLSARVVVDEDGEQGEGISSLYRWAQLNPFLNWLTDPAQVTGRLEIDVLYANHEMYQVRTKDGMLMDAAHTKAHLVQRLWRFSKEFDTTESQDVNAEKPWILSGILPM